MKKVAFLLTLIWLVGCAPEEVSPERETNNKLEGTWEVYSYRIANVEQIGDAIDFMTIRFTIDGIAGDMKWSIVESGNITTDTYTDPYTVINSNRVHLSATDYLLATFIANELRLSGSLGGYTVAIKAE